MIFGFPIQVILVVILFKQREKGVKITDTRVRLTTEVCLVNFSCNVDLISDTNVTIGSARNQTA